MQRYIPKIAVLLTVHNRIQKTIECLSNLFKQTHSNDKFLITVFLVDDGSTDGTKKEVEKLFSEVIIIEGNGNLFWNRGMIRAWKNAVEHDRYDYYLWLNDDTFLVSDCLKTLINDSNLKHDKAIIVGTTSAILTNNLTYGGYEFKNNNILTPNIDYLIECDYFNGNVVLIPNYVFEKVGYLDNRFRHALGDFEYGLRAGKKGIKLFISSKIVGKCDKHKTLPKWCNPDVKLKNRFKAFKSSLGPDVKNHFYFERTYFGLFKAIFHYLTINFRMLFPYFWKIK